MTEPKLPSLSVFLPCYNEEKNLQATFDSILPTLKSVTPDWEIVIINDGSRDRTGSIAASISKKYPKNVKVVTHNPNRGYGAAFKSGLYNSTKEWIALIDSDGQFDFGDIHNLITVGHDTGADLVIGYYLGRKVPFYRIWGSKVWQLAVFILFGLKVRDIDCGFKLIRRQVVETIPRLQAERGPFISSEFLIKAKKSRFKIVEVGVHHYARLHGEATGAKLNVILSGLKDLVLLWFKLNFNL